jgi:hypothetical protein
MAAHKWPASSRPRCTRSGSSVAAIPVYQSRSPHQNPVYNSRLSHRCYMFRPSQYSQFDHPKNIWWAGQIIQLVTVIQGVSKRALQLWKLIEIYTQRFELSKCNKTHRVLPRIVIRNCFHLFFDSFFTVPPPSPLRQGPMGHTAAITITMHMTK